MKESSEKESRPNPDPSTLTTDQLQREIVNLKELFNTRLAGLDVIIGIIRDDYKGLPALRQEAITHLQSLHEEKFRSISVQFTERDTRTEQTSRDSKVAVDAALQAAKEAVGEQNKSNAASITKSEAAFTKQIDAAYALITAQTKATDEKIEDAKTRLTTIESRTNGVQSQKQETNQNWGMVFGAVGMATGIIGLLLVAFKVVT